MGGGTGRVGTRSPRAAPDAHRPPLRYPMIKKQPRTLPDSASRAGVARDPE
jgi:hypothetical protein